MSRQFVRAPYVIKLGLCLVVATCGGDSDPSESEPSPAELGPQERALVEWEPEVLWERGGIDDDTVLYGPWSVHGGENQVVVLDWGGSRVRAFDPASGEVRWSFGRKGEGPGEFENPTDALVLGDGSTVVWDNRVGRLTWVTPDGRMGQLVPLNTQSLPSRFCEIEGGGLIALHPGGEPAVSMLAARGTLRGLEQDLPWIGLADLDPLQRQAEFATGPGGECVLYLTQSTGFARVDASGFGLPRGYIEPMAPPAADVREDEKRRAVQLGEFQLAVHAGVIRGSEIWLAFHGKTPLAGRLIDVYDLESGTYRRSYRLPWPISGLGAAADRIFFLRSVDGYPVLTASTAPTA